MAADSKTLTIRLIGNASSAVAAVGKTERAYTGLSGRMEKISQGFRNVGKKMTSTGQSATRNLTLPLVAAGAAVIKTAQGFEKSMNKVASITGATGGDFDKLREAAVRLGAATVFSSSEAADAMSYLGMAGFKTNEIISAMPGTLDLAAASGMGLADTADIMSNVLTGFGKSAKEAGKVSDVMAQVVRNANTDMRQLGDAMKYVAPVAAASGLSIHEVTAAVGLLGDAGIQGSMAGTTLRGAISRLLDPSAKASKVLKDLGINAANADGTLKPLETVVAQLGKSGATTADFMAVFGQRAGPGMQALVTRGSGALANLTGKLEKSGGVAKEMADRQMQGLTGAIEELKGAAETLAITLGDTGLLQVFSKGIVKVTEFIRGIADSNPKLLKIGVIAAAAAAAFGPLLVMLGMIVSAIGVLISPVGLVLAAVVALGAILVGAYAKSEKFRDAVAKIGEALKPIVKQVIEFGKSLIPVFKSLGSQLADKVGPILADIGNIIATKVIPAIEAILPVVMPVAKFLLEMFGSAVIGAIAGFLQVIKGVINVIAGVVGFVVNIIKGDWSAAWDSLVQIVKGVLDIIIGAFKVWWNAGILSLFKGGFKKLIGFFKSGWKAITGGTKGFLKSVGNILKNIIKVITWPQRKAMQLALRYITTGWKYITGGFTKGVGTVKSVLSRIIEVITWPYRRAFEIAKGLVSGGLRRIVDFFRNAPGNIKSALGRLKDAVVNVFSNAGSWLWNAGGKIIQGLIDGIASKFDDVKGKLGDLTGYVTQWKGPPKKDATLLRPAGRLVIDGFQRGLEESFGGVRRSLGGFTNNLHTAASSADLRASAAAAGSLPQGGAFGRSHGGPVVYVTVQGNVIGERDFAKRVTPAIREELVKTGKRNNGRIFD